MAHLAHALQGEWVLTSACRQLRVVVLHVFMCEWQNHGDCPPCMQRSPAAAWPCVSKLLLSPSHPFKAHQVLAAFVFQSWDVATLGPHPLYVPTKQTAQNSNAARFCASNADMLSSEASSLHSSGTAHIDKLCRALGLCDETHAILRQWEQLHAMSVYAPERFWPRFLTTIGFRFSQQPRCVLELSEDGNPDNCRWFPGARLNIAAAALQGQTHDPDAQAIVSANEADPAKTLTLTYRELGLQVKHVAATLLAAGQGPGCRVAIIMPMTAFAVALYLAVVFIGGAVVSIAESFSAAEMQTRLQVGEATLVVVQVQPPPPRPCMLRHWQHDPVHYETMHIILHVLIAARWEGPACLFKCVCCPQADFAECEFCCRM